MDMVTRKSFKIIYFSRFFPPCQVLSRKFTSLDTWKDRKKKKLFSFPKESKLMNTKATTFFQQNYLLFSKLQNVELKIDTEGE